MSGLLAAIRDLFVAPAGTPAATRAQPPPAPCLAVLARPPEAMAATAALALALARAHGTRCALACGWRIDWSQAPRIGAGGDARHLALRLDARGIAADASGRLVRARLPEDAAAAAAAAERAVAAATCPAVLGLAGPREPALDRLLASPDAVVVVHPAEADAALAGAVEASLAGLPVPVVGCRVSAARPIRALTAAGVYAPPGVRQALLPALEAVA
jgi:hypothetical protein